MCKFLTVCKAARFQSIAAILSYIMVDIIAGIFLVAAVGANPGIFGRLTTCIAITAVRANPDIIGKPATFIADATSFSYIRVNESNTGLKSDAAPTSDPIDINIITKTKVAVTRTQHT
jgi:hypothetical protein